MSVSLLQYPCIPVFQERSWGREEGRKRGEEKRGRMRGGRGEGSRGGKGGGRGERRIRIRDQDHESGSGY